MVALAEKLSASVVTLRFDYRGIGQSRIDLPAGVGLFRLLGHDRADAGLSRADARHVGCGGGAVPDERRIADGRGRVFLRRGDGCRIAVGDSRFVGMVGIAAPFSRITFEHLSNCPKPCLMVSGIDDFVYSPDVADKLINNAGDQLVMDRLDSADHFFRRQEQMLATRVMKFFDGLRSR